MADIVDSLLNTEPTFRKCMIMNITWIFIWMAEELKCFYTEVSDIDCRLM